VNVVNTKGENINICWSPDGNTIAVGNKVCCLPIHTNLYAMYLLCAYSYACICVVNLFLCCIPCMLCAPIFMSCTRLCSYFYAMYANEPIFMPRTHCVPILCHVPVKLYCANTQYMFLLFE
jgi:hypothetical protein